MEAIDWGQLLKAIGSVGHAGAGIFSAFQKQPLPPGYLEALQAQNDARTYLAASADPSSAYFQNLAATEEQRGRNDLISAVHELIRQNASRLATGRGTINPERRDETIWGMLAKGFQEAGLRAREVARQRLIDMAGGSSAMARNYGGLSEIGLYNQALNSRNRNTGISGAFETISRTGDAFKKKQGTTSFGTASVPDTYKTGPSMGYDFWG